MFIKNNCAYCIHRYVCGNRDSYSSFEVSSDDISDRISDFLTQEKLNMAKIVPALLCLDYKEDEKSWSVESVYL